MHGIQVKAERLFKTEKRQHIPLPTYPFQKQKYWLEADKRSPLKNVTQLYKSVWSYKDLHTSFSIERANNHDWIIFSNKKGIGSSLVDLLLEQNIRPFIIEPGNSLQRNLAVSIRN